MMIRSDTFHSICVERVELRAEITQLYLRQSTSARQALRRTSARQALRRTTASPLKRRVSDSVLSTDTILPTVTILLL